MYAKLFIITFFLMGFCYREALLQRTVSVFNTQIVVTNIKEKSKEICGYGKSCVLEYLCANTTTTEDGRTLINVRFDFEELKVCAFLEKCCSKNDIVQAPIVKLAETTTGCGYRNINGVGFKINGTINDSQFGEFPWMLAILQVRNDPDKERNIYRGGGSLIHPQVVLTAAHCVYDSPASTYKVRAGEWEIIGSKELHPHQDRRVADMVVHEDFNSRNMQNDLALLFLETPFELAPNVNTVCLPPAGFNFDAARGCYATGWGREEFPKGNFQNILKKVEISVVPRNMCQNQLRQTRLSDIFKLHWSFLCAGGEQYKDTCEGDGGSPLVCPIDNTENRYYQAGIVAWGIECGLRNVPGVYVNVAKFRTWIDGQLANRNVKADYTV